jgi:hypothetical protein
MGTVVIGGEGLMSPPNMPKYPICYCDSLRLINLGLPNYLQIEYKIKLSSKIANCSWQILTARYCFKIYFSLCLEEIITGAIKKALGNFVTRGLD